MWKWEDLNLRVGNFKTPFLNKDIRSIICFTRKQNCGLSRKSRPTPSCAIWTDPEQTSKNSSQPETSPQWPKKQNSVTIASQKKRKTLWKPNTKSTKYGMISKWRILGKMAILRSNIWPATSRVLKFCNWYMTPSKTLQSCTPKKLGLCLRGPRFSAWKLRLRARVEELSRKIHKISVRALAKLKAVRK